MPRRQSLCLPRPGFPVPLFCLDSDASTAIAIRKLKNTNGFEAIAHVLQGRRTQGRQCQILSNPWHAAATACVRAARLSTKAGQFAQIGNDVEPPVTGRGIGGFQRPGHAMRHMDAPGPRLQGRDHVGFQRIAHHHRLIGPGAMAGKDRRGRRRRSCRRRSRPPWNRSPRPDCASLRSWSRRSPLVIRITR